MKPHPAPWQTDPSAFGIVYTDMPDCRHVICTASTEANARLIAAAPDLLAALRLFVVAYETNMPPPGYSPHNWRLMREKCRAALARAE